jgi:prophage antirepressor-like protein
MGPILDRRRRPQTVRIIFEPDVYALIFGSHLPDAAEFRPWVFEEVPPSIREHSPTSVARR